jgi:tetratricopeptide (TPR) repeat protein
VDTTATHAQATLEASQFDEALRQAELLLVASPVDWRGLMAKAQGLVGLGRREEALHVLRGALSTYPDDEKMIAYARNVAIEHGGLEAASEFALRFAEIAPDDPKNEIILMRWLLSIGQPETVLARADKLLATGQDVPRSAMVKAQALLSLQRPDDALNTLHAAVSTNRDNRQLLTMLRNILFDTGALSEAKLCAERIATIAPGESKNQVFLIRCCLALGDFEDALSYSDALLVSSPDVRALMLRAQALEALHRVREALSILTDGLVGHPDDTRLLRLLRTVAFQNGRFDLAVDCALRLSRLQPQDDRLKAYVVQAYLASGHPDSAKEYMDGLGSCRGVLRKEAYWMRQYDQLAVQTPAVVHAWHLALSRGEEVTALSTSSVGDDPLNATMIQYWSQGALPNDVQIVHENWKMLFDRERLGTIELYDRASAEAWIADHAPEFATIFSKSFHYAMESDIFRIAYASKRACIYMDIDSWPLEHTAEILRFAVRSQSSMLYFRSHRPAVVNGFFVAVVDCPFFKQLTQECLVIDVDGLPRDYAVVESTFGPSRYNKVLCDLLRSTRHSPPSRVEDVPGCSLIDLKNSTIHFTHDAAVASVRPPFPLGYKATADYWKRLSTNEA